MKILAVESSCDDTAAAVINDSFQIQSNIVTNQHGVHGKFGGVVPELASREHIIRIMPTIIKALREAECELDDLDGLAVTYGPGLMGSLLVGLQAIKGIAVATGLPWIGIHHLEGHLSASMLAPNPPQYPFLALLVSGGHTIMLKVEDFGHYYFLGGTRDDAAGEAFDKVSKLIGLGYPGGVAMEKAAQGGDPSAIAFPRPMRSKKNPYDFSFSGLKTAALHEYQNNPPASKQALADFCASFNEAIADTLVYKAINACKRERLNRIVLGGGVAANARLRALLTEKSTDSAFIQEIFLPPKPLCTDNAAMIGAAGIIRLSRNEYSSFELNAHPNAPLAPSTKSTARTVARTRRRGLNN